MDTTNEEVATKLIPNLDPALIEYVRTRLKDRIENHGLKPTAHYSGYIVLFYEGIVHYFVRYKRVRHNGLRIGRQVLLWRNRELHEVTGGFAQRVFFDFLLPRYGALIADKEQTTNGSLFWRNAIQGAFARRLHVYCLDRRSRKTNLTELFDNDDVDEYRKILWGREPQHLLTFAVIANQELTLE